MSEIKTLSAIDALRQANGNVRKASELMRIPRTTLYSRVVTELVSQQTPQLDIVEEHQLRRKLKDAQRQRDEAVSRASEEAERNAALERLATANLDPPEWLLHKPKGKTHHGTVTAFLSDTHFDEVVNAAELSGVNAYNRDIAVLRLQEFFQGTIKLTRDYIAGIKIDGLVLPLGGDMVTGNIHEELERTNDAPVLDTCVFWAEQIAAGIDLQLKFFPKVFVPCVTGNHGRLRKKPQYKQRARDNYDWLIYQIVAKHFRGNDRVSFAIPDGPDVRYRIYNTDFMLTHGDEFTGGNGIGGLAVPIMRGDAQKQKVAVALKQTYDVMLIGHWHQRRNFGSVRINGTMKGYDEYAKAHRFQFELPQQDLFVTTPERGITIETPVFVRSKQEKW